MKKSIITVISAVFVFLLLAAAAIYILLDRSEADGGTPLAVYFYNASASMLEAEEHAMVAAGTDEQLEEAVAHIFGLPHTASLTRPWPDREGFLLDCKMNGNILEANFSGQYNELPPVDEALFSTAFVLTMEALPFVDHVQIIPEGVSPADTAFLNSTNTGNNPIISPARIIASTYTLYFVSADATGLVAREYTSSQVDQDQKEKFIIDELIARQNSEGVFPTIPVETGVSVEKDESSSTCYVNFTSEIQRFNGNAELAKLMLYSIVNSLTELTNVKQVQFQIDSERVDQFKGVTGFDQVFKRDDTLVVG
jgi:germination protein M